MPAQFLLVFAGDLGSAGRLGGATPVDKDSFADVLLAACPSIAAAMKTPIAEFDASLTLDSLRAFEPEGLLRQTAPGRARLDLRAIARSRQVGKLTAGDLQNALAAAAGSDRSLAWLATPPPASPVTAAASVLDLVDEPAASGGVADDVSRIAASAGDAISSAEAARLRSTIERLDLELRQLADALLKHPDVRRLETNWRSLKYLVDHIDFRAGVRLSVIDAPRESALDRLISDAFEPAFDGQAPTPGMVLLDFGIANLPPDLELLHAVAQHAASLPTVVTFPLEGDFFGVKSLRLLKNLPNLASTLDGFQFAKWKALRDQDYARTLAPVVGKFILRQPYAAAPGGDTFAHAESVAAVNDLLWAGGHVAMGICAARAFANHNWPTRMFGIEAGRIADLPIVPNPNDRNSPWGPGDLVLPDQRLDELPTCGINPLISMTGTDYCALLGGVTVKRPVVTADTGKQQAALQISLPYQLFSCITSAWLCEQISSLSGLSRQDAQLRLIVGLRDLLGLAGDDSPDAVAVAISDSPSGSGRSLVQIRVTPPGKIVPGGLEMDFGFEF